MKKENFNSLVKVASVEVNDANYNARNTVNTIKGVLIVELKKDKSNLKELKASIIEALTEGGLKKSAIYARVKVALYCLENSTECNDYQKTLVHIESEGKGKRSPRPSSNKKEEDKPQAESSKPQAESQKLTAESLYKAFLTLEQNERNAFAKMIFDHYGFKLTKAVLKNVK